MPKGAETHHRPRDAGKRICDLSPEIVHATSSGKRETRTWTEWMGVDTAKLVSAVAIELHNTALGRALASLENQCSEGGILTRLKRVGRVISDAVPDFDDPTFQVLIAHRSDAVRQWGAYAVNDPSRSMDLQERLDLTLTFAADPHMSVRECAWMAFRPFLLSRVEESLVLLEPIARAPDPRLRRFAIEVSRPRSVWGTHCAMLKNNPELGQRLLNKVRHEQNRYVQLAAGNWLNDASKTRPDWVEALCADWLQDGNDATNFIVKRGLRTLTIKRSVEDNPERQLFAPGVTRVTFGG